MFRKGLAVAVILLFISVSAPSSGFGAENHCLINDSIGYFNSIRQSEERGVNVTLNGTMGENGWYISCVYIQISFGPDVQSFYYQFNGGGWQQYTEPFGPICEDGEHTFCWYYVDNEGNQSDVECIDFKIDQTPPEIFSFIIEKIGFTKWLFTAEVSDAASGINRVEFYVDERLVGIVTEEPYEWEWSGMGSGHVVQAIVCDNAGNYGLSPPAPQIPPTRVLGIICNLEFTDEDISFFAMIVISNTFHPCILRQLTFQNDYSGYISERFIFAVFEYGPV